MSDYASQVSEIRKLDALLMAAIKTGSAADQRRYERARQSYCFKHGLTYVPPVWPRDRKIAS